TLASLRSLTAASSTSASGRLSTARVKFRPIRPNPLIPMRTVIGALPFNLRFRRGDYNASTRAAPLQFLGARGSEEFHCTADKFFRTSRHPPCYLPPDPRLRRDSGAGPTPPPPPTAACRCWPSPSRPRR